MTTNIAHQHGDHTSGYITPEVKASEGFNSVGAFYPAPWLPIQRYNEEKFTHVVISRGKPVAFAGANLVPAGLKLDYDAVKAGSETDATIRYTQVDVDNGVQNAQGTLVTVGEAVVTALIALNVEVSYFCGIANYDYFRHPGGDGFNPATLRRYNFRPQSTVSFNMDYHYEYPLVVSDADYVKAPYRGISAFVAATVKPGQFVTYDKNSNFTTCAADFTQGVIPKEAIVGQVTIVHIVKDASTKKVLTDIGGLNRVVAPENISGNILNETPSVRNGGMPQKIEYANAIGFVHFGLQTR